MSAKMKKWIPILLSGAMLLSACGNQGEPVTINDKVEGIRAIMANYPEQPGNGDPQEFLESDAHWEWWDPYRKNIEESINHQDGMDAYYAAILKQLLVTEDEENTVCSPLNIYIAFAMLAETTDGEAREQILSALQVRDIGELRARVTALWKANYADTPVIKSLLADSLWLRDNLEYNEGTLRTLAENYYASAFYGPMGTEEMNRALQDWTNENTGGLLEEYVRELKTDPATVLALISTIYFKAAWMDEFYDGETSDETFHGTEGDAVVQMMHRSDDMNYFEGEHFTAVSLPLNDSGSMTFYLPDEGTDVNDLITEPDLLTAAAGPYPEENSRFALVHLSIPKFKADRRTDLLKIMEQLGMTDVLVPGLADFSPLTEDAEEMYVSSAEHAAIVEIDESGVTGAAYTAIMVAEGAMLIEDRQELDFVLDRPFAFLITGRDGSVLFGGVVKNINS